MAESTMTSDFINPPFRRRVDIEDFIKAEFISAEKKYPEHEHFHYSTINVYTTDILNKKGYDRFGKMKYVKDDLVYTLCKVDFILVLNEEIWDASSDINRKAIIDHFLHTIRAQYFWEDPETQKIVRGDYYDLPDDPGINLKFQTTKSGRLRWKSVKPIGEFPDVIRRYGGWNGDIKDMQSSFIAKEKNEF